MKQQHNRKHSEEARNSAGNTLPAPSLLIGPLIQNNKMLHLLWLRCAYKLSVAIVAI
jgi:hypothetical protein